MRHKRGRIESDWYPHGQPIDLEGGQIAVVTDNEGFQTAVLTVLEDPRALRAERIYRVRVRRSFPYAAMGLPLSIKSTQSAGLKSSDYIGFSYQNATDRNVDTGCGDGWSHGHERGHDGEDCKEVIVENVLAQVIDAVMFGYGNRAMLDDTVLHTAYGNEPDPFIHLYLNTEGVFVVMEAPKRRCHQPRRMVIERRETIIEPFKAKTIGINQTGVEMFQPRSWGHSESFVGAPAPRLNRPVCAGGGAGFW